MKKKHIIIICIVIIITLILGGIVLFFLKKAGNKRADVYTVSSIISEYYGSEAENEGIVTNNVSQSIYLEEDQSVGEVYVEEGQQVKEGDKIFSYDVQEAQTELEIKELELQNTKDQLELDKRELVKLQNTTPIPDEPEETTEEPTDEPVEEETPEEVVEPKTGDAYNILDKDAKAYEGDGSDEKPYRYLCTDKAYITGEMINILAGYNAAGTKKKTDPKTAIFEVHKSNKEEGKIIYSWTLVGKNNKPVDPTVKWNLKGYEIEESDTDTEDSTTDDADSEVDATDDTSTSESDSENDTTEYDSESLQTAITDAKQSIQDGEVEVKTAELEYKAAKKKVDESVVCSKINGVIKSIGATDAKAGEPYISIAGSEGLFIKGYINELELDEIKVGQKVTATNYESGETFEAEIKEISKYPTSETYYGNGNSNSSYYPYIAYVDNADGLTNGDYVSLKVEKSADTASNLVIPIYLVKNEGSNYYVYIADENDRLKKKNVKISAIYSEWGSIIVESGLSQEDRIAFPYGDTAKEGLKVKDAELDIGYEEE